MKWFFRKYLSLSHVSKFPCFWANLCSIVEARVLFFNILNSYQIHSEKVQLCQRFGVETHLRGWIQNKNQWQSNHSGSISHLRGVFKALFFTRISICGFNPLIMTFKQQSLVIFWTYSSGNQLPILLVKNLLNNTHP